MKKARILQLVGGLVIAGGGLWIFFRDVDLGKLVSEIRATPAWAVALCAALSIVSLWFRAIRARYILPDTPNTHKRGLFPNVMIGFMANNIFPARVGEAARVVLLWKKNNYGPVVGVGSLLVERLLDIATFGLFMVLGIFTIASLSSLLPFAWLISGGLGGGLLFLILYRLFPSGIKGFVERIVVIVPGKFRSRLQSAIHELFDNLQWVFSNKDLTSVAILSVVIELCYAAMAYVLVGSFGLRMAIGALFTTAFVAIGAAIPLAPGYVGTLHAMLLSALVMLGVNEDKGRAIAIVYHAASYLPVTLLGLFYFFKTDLSFGQISKSKEELDSATPHEVQEGSDAQRRAEAET